MLIKQLYFKSLKMIPELQLFRDETVFERVKACSAEVTVAFACWRYITT